MYHKQQQKQHSVKEAKLIAKLEIVQLNKKLVP